MQPMVMDSSDGVMFSDLIKLIQTDTYNNNKTLSKEKHSILV